MPKPEPNAARPLAAAVDLSTLPAPIPLEDLITTHDPDPAPDPEMGRDPNHEWMLRHG